MRDSDAPRAGGPASRAARSLRSGSWPAQVWRRRHGFELRLLGTLVLTLVVVGAFQYVVNSRDTERHLQEWVTQRARGDVVFIEQAFSSQHDSASRVREMNERLRAIQARPNIRHVLLIDRFGVVAAASKNSDLGTYHGGASQRAVIASGRPIGQLAVVDGQRVFRYVVPVDLPSGRYVLEVEQDSSVIESQLEALRHSAMIVVVIGIVVGVVLFFLLGGRSLAETHRHALRLSTRDALTSLDNHRSFQESLMRSVAQASRQGSPLSVALVDLDDFKLVNDRLGHREGDEVLKKAAAQLRGGRAGDRAFRIGGDEFALILPETDSDGARLVCDRLWRGFSSGQVGVTVSVGVATLDDQLDGANLQERADVALYEAKRRGRNGVVSFEELAGAAVVPVEKVRAVRQLLDDARLGTAFQPIWHRDGDRLLGFEALARPPEDYGISSAGELFSIAELIGRTPELDALAWESALRRAADLPSDVLLFLNISPFTADHGDGPINRLHDIVRASPIDPGRVVVELTEKWSGRRDLVVEQAERLRALGFGLALDDVGAGSGDLEMMARLPVDFIKVDLKVVQKARTDVTARGVLFAITAFASHSGSRVIAEGIEDAETLAFLRASEPAGAPGGQIHGCQGYHLGRPVEGPPSMPAAPLTAAPSKASR